VPLVEVDYNIIYKLFRTFKIFFFRYCIMKKISKQSDGKYHVRGATFKVLHGSRAQVWHGTACRTSGGLTKAQLFMNKRGHIVSRKKHNTAKREKRLQRHGYFTKKGKFGAVKRDARVTRTRTRRRKR
jgi:hypothetical protein